MQRTAPVSHGSGKAPLRARQGRGLAGAGSCGRVEGSSTVLTRAGRAYHRTYGEVAQIYGGSARRLAELCLRHGRLNEDVSDLLQRDYDVVQGLCKELQDLHKRARVVDVELGSCCYKRHHLHRLEDVFEEPVEVLWAVLRAPSVGEPVRQVNPGPAACAPLRRHLPKPPARVGRALDSPRAPR